MYLKKIVCKNMGPISHIDIEPGFDEKGNPKPLILVGKNGTGKSILISNIVDSFFEFGDQAYSDLTHKTQYGHSYFKMSGGAQIQIGQKDMACFLKYTAGEKEENAEYLHHVGEFDIEKFKAGIADNFRPTIYDQNKEKNLTVANELFEKEFNDKVIAYFPPERFSIPYWMGTSYSASHNYGDINLDDKIRNILNKPIIVGNATKENTQWLIDVIVDAKANLIRTNTDYRISDIKNYEALQISKNNIERIISAIVEDTLTLELLWRHNGKSRLRLNSTEGGKVFVPTIDALSTGQMVLLNMFLTIVRYADSADINKSIQLQNIIGLVVIDEIELHLHSDLQKNVLPKLIKLFPKVQFIITSHSPLFLLGMREIFQDDGFDIYEMPDGRRIEAEDFSEFEHAYDAMTATRRHRANIQKAIQERVSANKKALIITEGPTDWKHMKYAWDKLKDLPEYAGLDGKFDFLEYEPENSKNAQGLKLKMGDGNLKKMCDEFSKIVHPCKIIFIADRDVEETVKKLSNEGKIKHYKNQGIDTNVYSFVLPVPEHRKSTPNICIEHYYSDKELKTPLEIDGIPRTLFRGSDFNSSGFGIDEATEYYCSNSKICGPDKIGIIDGGNDIKITLKSNNGEGNNYALPKMYFVEAIVNEKDGFKDFNFDSFKSIFNILKEIIIPSGDCQ